MKLYTTALLLACTFGCTQNGMNEVPQNIQGPRIKFEVTSHTGPVVAGHIRFRYTFTNEGNDDLKILNVSSSCGCTTSRAERNVLAPGESSHIDADMLVSDTRRSSSIYLSTNDSLHPQVTLALRSSTMPPNYLEFLPNSIPISADSETVGGTILLKGTFWAENNAGFDLNRLLFTSSDPDLTIKPVDISSASDMLILWSDSANSARTHIEINPSSDRKVFLIPVAYQYRLTGRRAFRHAVIKASVSGSEETIPAILVVSAEVKPAP